MPSAAKIYHLNKLAESVEALRRFKLAATVYEVMIKNARESLPELLPNAINNCAVAYGRAGDMRQACCLYAEYIKASPNPDLEMVGHHLLKHDSVSGEALILLANKAGDGLKSIVTEKLRAFETTDDMSLFLSHVRHKFHRMGFSFQIDQYRKQHNRTLDRRRKVCDFQKRQKDCGACCPGF